ncbi:MAG TPA: antibiotic ABC transporter ATP-binding protein [Deltaproteobacteria bacterium]|nr:antibiotic ABC transporter ATP-binding protein [Deltaproteobacteria bacterium]
MSNGTEFYFTEDRVETRGMDVRLLRRLLSYLSPHKGLLAAALGALVLGTACQLAGPYIIKLVIDRNITPRVLDGLAGRVALFLAALAGGMGFLYLQMFAVSIIGQRVILQIRAEMFGRLQRLPVSFFDRTPTGRVMTRLTSDVEALQELISSGLVSTVGSVTILVGIAAVLVWMDARLTLVTFAVLPFLVLFVELLKKFIREANREMRRKLARLNAFLQEHVTGVDVVKAFVQEEKSGREFDVHNDAYSAESIRLTNFYSVYFPGVELFASVAVALLLWQGGIRVIAGAVTFGTLVAFLEYAQKFFAPIKDVSDKYNILQSALASSERIFQILDTEVSPEYRPLPSGGKSPLRPVEERGRERATQLPPPAIEFRDVWFSYPKGDGEQGETVLRGVSFTLHEGETGAIVGATGAGKTTVLNLLCRFYEISRGEIRLFGRDVREIPREELRGMISLVLQDPFLFSGTIRENVEAGGAELGRALGVAGVSRFAAAWESGLATQVGERGGRLSVGQRQLVSFARALARDPEVLVLDEATSSVDPVTEHEVQAALGKILSGRTSLVVAHRLSTILSADRILVMHRGKVRETGTHRELLAARGIYHRLYTLQFGTP